MPQVQVDLYQVLIGFIVLIGFQFKLMFDNGQNKKDIVLLWQKHDDLSEKLGDELNSMNRSLARIEGRLSIETKK